MVARVELATVGARARLRLMRRNARGSLLTNRTRPSTHS